VGGGAGSLGLTAWQSLKNDGTGNTGKNLFTTGAMFFEGGLFVLGLSGLAKAVVNRPRPYAYNPNVSFKDKTAGEDYKESFFSGTSAITSYGMFFTAKLINDMYPESNWNYVGWGSAAAYSGYVAWLATDAGHHFPTDVLTGSLLGAGIAILIPELHKSEKQTEKNHLIFIPV
jgi:membrane-associated phospholipid phosphatase